jgi:hypothetical protein
MNVIKFWQKIMQKMLIIVYGLSMTLSLTAHARDQWQNSQNPQFQSFPQYTSQQALQTPPGYFKSFSPDFWKNRFANQLSAGTVLTAILEDDLASNKNQAGDTFTLILQDGYVSGGLQVIPSNSRIVGTIISAMPAKSFRQGSPGRLDVSLQTLIFPNGKHIPIFANIDHNPNHDLTDLPKKRFSGPSLADYGQSVVSMFGSFTSGLGFMLNRRNQGADFALKKGEVLPVRLSRTLQIPEGINQSFSPLFAPAPVNESLVPAPANNQTQAPANKSDPF